MPVPTSPTSRAAAPTLGSGRQAEAARDRRKKLGLEKSLGSRLVIYADDLVILCRRGNAEPALHRLREIMGKPRPASR